MKKIFIILSISILIFLSATAQTSQRKFGSPVLNTSYEDAFQKMMQKHEQFANNRKALTVYNIPVVFHIVHSGQAVGTSLNISQAQINSQITVLNQDFRKTNTDFATTVTQSAFINAAADCEINFCLAKVSPTGALLAEPGIDRIKCSDKGWTNPPHVDTYIDATIKPSSIWDPTNYFNIWVVYMNDGTLGYAQFPTILTALSPVTDMYNQGGLAVTDGVVLDYKAIGNTGTATSPYNKGRTATHEIGHWLGLWHINGDTNCGDDYCSDTPTQNSLTSGCPSTTGGTSASGCSGSPNPPGRMYQNYMDYSDDRCLTMFTSGQKARMQAVMANCVRRASLATSTVCAAIGIEENSSNVYMEVYPNPTNGEFYVDITTLDVLDFTISVVNTLGQSIKEVKQVQSNGGKIKIDLSDKNTGVYFVIIKSKLGSKVKRIVLQ